MAAVHALAYPIGGIYHVPHGLSNALVLPHVLRFNAEAAAPLYAELADVIVPGMTGSAESRTLALIERLEQMIAATAIPARVAAMSASERSGLERMAERRTGCCKRRLLVNLYPRPVTEADALAIYTAAF